MDERQTDGAPAKKAKRMCKYLMDSGGTAQGGAMENVPYFQIPALTGKQKMTEWK